MRPVIAGVGVIGLATTLLAINKAVEALAIVPLTSNGMKVAAQGGDITPYLLAMIGLLVAVALPVGLVKALANS
jgi:hypothetical protein